MCRRTQPLWRGLTAIYTFNASSLPLRKALRTMRLPARCRKPIWMGIPSVRLLLTPQLCEQIVGRLDIAEGHQKLAQRVIVQRIRLVGVTV